MMDVAGNRSAWRGWLKTLAIPTLFLAVLPSDGQANSPVIGASKAQGLLNLLAQPTDRGALPAGFPAFYKDWTEEQRTLGLRRVAGQCRVLWGMMNDQPFRLLSEGQTEADGSRLAQEVCLTARLPVDWPGRGAALADMRRILGRSKELGYPLRLPPTLTP